MAPSSIGDTSTDTPKPAATPEFAPTPLPPDDDDSLDTAQLRKLILERDNHIERITAKLTDLQSAHSDLLQRSSQWRDELESVNATGPKRDDEAKQGEDGFTSVSLKDEVEHGSSSSPPPQSPSDSATGRSSSSSSSSTSGAAENATEAALKAQVTSLKQTNSALEDQVRDLRIRFEESRRAIMRLQNEQSDIRAKAKAENRRSLAVASVAVSSAAGGGGGGGGASQYITWNPATFQAMADAEEAKELKKSKRASLAFGPNAVGSRTSYASSGHRRTASGSSTGTNSGAVGAGVPGVNVDAGSGAESESDADHQKDINATPIAAIGGGAGSGLNRGSVRMSGGLRGLRLSGIISSGSGGNNGSAPSPGGLLSSMFNSNNDDDGKSSSSRRTSFNSAAGANQPPRSPISDVPDTVSDIGDKENHRLSNRYSLSGSRPVMIPNRQSSSGSVLSNGTVGDDALAPPGSSGRFSVSPSPSLHSKVGSPILEEQQQSPIDGAEGDSPKSRFSTLTGTNRTSAAAAAAASGKATELQSEVDRLKRELAKAKLEIDEANEARSASEECLRALKDFIAKHDDLDNNGNGAVAPPTPAKEKAFAAVPSRNTSSLSAGQTAALKGLKLPPLPSSTDDDAQTDAERTPHGSSSAASFVAGMMSPGRTPTAPTAAASAGTNATANGSASTGGMWSSSNWSARFSGFPQLMRMSSTTSAGATSAPAAAPAPASTPAGTMTTGASLDGSSGGVGATLLPAKLGSFLSSATSPATPSAPATATATETVSTGADVDPPSANGEGAKAAATL
ncbi:hypothetical protein OC846_005033 [Tilletia horrida]|uniref:Uncharacterized protein n=1 Tax=Tilletia horrida TaxID=155126 RepID=A0AAN6GM78_9BASI|nr:hypothetical protein OC846_005033 [Tilletia horrida]KAK0564871.1 hypothetical protein OC861_004048 [Tilletia horrida]